MLRTMVQVARALLVAVSMAIAVPSLGAPAAFEGKELRGINVTLAANPSRRDFDEIRGWGANSIRLVIHADPDAKRNDDLLMGASGSEVNPSGLEKLRATALNAVSSGLKVVVDMHSWPCRENGELWRNESCWNTFRHLWAEIAKTFKDTPGVVGYDLMNEPDLVKSSVSAAEFLLVTKGHWAFPNNWRGTDRDYFRLMTLVARDIAAIDRSKTIIVGGVGAWGKPSNFRWMEPIGSVPNPVCYSFHMYIPNRFTDQGKQRKGKGLEVGVGYPLRSFDRADLYRAMSDVVKFQQQTGACIYVGEFGVTKFTEGLGGDRWLQDVVDFFSTHGWHSAYWSYSVPVRSLEFFRNGEGELVDGEGERMAVMRQYWASKQ